MRALPLARKTLLKALHFVVVWLLALSVIPGICAISGPSPTIDAFDYSAAGAQAAWTPMRGSLPVESALLENRRVLRFLCNFKAGFERVSWDRQVNLDLSRGNSFEFEILCRDASPVSYFSLYFQSGEGWYHGSFYPESSTGWGTIRIEKNAMSIEGTPAGWGRITTIRVSAWRGQNKEAEFYLRDLRQAGILGGDATVAVLRCDSAAKRSSEESRNVEQFTENVAQHLRALGLGYVVVNDTDPGAELFKGAKVIVLPYNPSMDEMVADQVKRNLESGGKLLAFYLLPDRLQQATGIGAMTHTKASAPGSFSAIRALKDSLPGAPDRVDQKSWNTNVPSTNTGPTRTLAEWLDAEGRATGQPAIVASSNCVFMSHVLLQDDPAGKRRLLLAMVGRLDPGIWGVAAEAALRKIGVLGEFGSYDEAIAGIAKAGGKKVGVMKTLADARAARDTALGLSRAQRFAECIEQAGTANEALNQAFCLAQDGLPGEFRAFWCHSAFGVQGMNWEEAAKRLAENGFTAIFPNMLWGGAAFYPSKVLPVAAPVESRGDQIAQCLAACRKHGIQVHVWKVNWNLGHAVPQDFVERMRRERRLQAGQDGKEQPWLCPSHPKNQKMEIDSMVEVARDYGIDGIHFDYIRYPDSEHCFCAGCKERFSRATSARNLVWPGDVLADGAERQSWLQWRRDNITTVVKGVSERARAVNPRIKISAAVFPIWFNERDTIGQDWKLWCEKGYLDFVCPMDYTSSNSNFANMVRRQLEWAGKTPCYPGIGASASTSQFGADKVISQINITRGLKTDGFVIFNYGVNESKELLPMLGLGITRTSSQR